MDQVGVITALVMPPPSPVQNVALEDQFMAVARNHGRRFGFLGGGRSLNGMIQEALAAGEVSPELKDRFVTRATQIVAAGALGFGEMTALHLSFFPNHPYLEAPPDHPLFLLLADLAADLDMPIDLHMEAVVEDMATPPQFLRISPNNAPLLAENISAFERLLDHNLGARILWAHVGWDNTGHMSPTLLRGLLESHSNLYLQLKGEAVRPWQTEHSPLAPNGDLRPEWRELVQTFPERFLLGSDAFYGAGSGVEERLWGTGRLLVHLPADVASLVGWDNAARIYHRRVTANQGRAGLELE